MLIDRGRGTGKTLSIMVRTVNAALECPGHWVWMVDHDGVHATKHYAESFANGLGSICQQLAIKGWEVDIREGLPCVKVNPVGMSPLDPRTTAS